MTLNAEEVIVVKGALEAAIRECKETIRKVGASHETYIHTALRQYESLLAKLEAM